MKTIRTQQKIAERLNVSHRTICVCPHDIGKIQKTEKTHQFFYYSKAKNEKTNRITNRIPEKNVI